MKKFFPHLDKVGLCALFFLVSIQQSVAQQEPLGQLVSITEFTIKSGHNEQFREGVKAWKACYLENEGDWTWRLWHRQQGEGNVYVLASSIANWAEMDKSDESGKECQNLTRTLINPHIEKATNHLTRLLPGISKGSPLTEEIIRVTFFKTNSENGHKMMEVVNEVVEIRKNSNIEPLGFWYNSETAGPDGSNYHLAIPYNNYAAMDIEQESVWETIEKSAGKEKRDELQAAFRSSLEKTWNYFYKLDKDISRPNK
ncbi:MAG TPA: hypothetical protein VK921_08470 [Anditalea sp.]|nr:hypothetical protein [Anditalea sp.]